MVIPLAQPGRSADSKGQPFQQTGTKVTAAEAEAKFVEVSLEVLLGQTMIRTQDECLGIADHDVKPMKQAGVGIIRLVFMDKSLQCRDVTAVTVAPDRTALGKRRLGELFDRGPLDILRDLHLDVAGISPLIQPQKLSLFLFHAPVSSQQSARRNTYHQIQ